MAQKVDHAHRVILASTRREDRGRSEVSAVRALDRLRHKVASAIAEFVAATLSADPYRVSNPLQFEFEGWRLARRGDYRSLSAHLRTTGCSTAPESEKVHRQ
jgi:hypothetical protein